jgi:hypothetical protein
MPSAKDIKVHPIKSADARAFIERWHYSGKTVNNSQLHFGAFIDGRLIGVMQYGCPMDKSKVLPLVRDTKWNDMLELNRMAMIDATPKNTESRFIAITVKIIKKAYPNIEWILSFSDGCQCGDGTIYRASGFFLTGIKENTGQCIIKSETFSRMTLDTGKDAQRRAATLLGVSGVYGYADAIKKGAKVLPGFQLRYILPLKPGVRERLTVPVLPYSEITKRGAGMYLGKSRAGSIVIDAPPVQGGEGGAEPTPALHL